MSDKGGSHGLWTLFTYVAAIVCMIVYSAGSHNVGAWLSIFVAPLVLLANFIGLAVFALRFWLPDYHPFFPHQLFPHLKIHGKAIPWQLLRIVDHAFAYVAAWAFLFLALWMWDTHRFYEIHVDPAKENVWAAGAVLLRTATMILVTEGGLPFEPKEVVSTLLFTFDAKLSFFVVILVISVVAAHVFEAHRGREKTPDVEEGGKELIVTKETLDY